MNKKDFVVFYAFLHKSEKLKTELRHSWTSCKKRRESVAEHTWMTSLIALVIMNKLDKRIDGLKLLKMIIVHDLVEAIAGDIPSHEISKRILNKHKMEAKAIKLITKNLGKTGNEIKSLWFEFEDKSSYEAKVAYALDKYECLVQHNIADIETWDSGDYRYTLNQTQDEPFNFSRYIRKMKDLLDDRTYAKCRKAGTLKKVPEENTSRYRGRKLRR